MAFALFFTAIFGIAALSMRASDAYREAMARASADPAVIAALGSPVEAGLFVSGSVSVNGPSGNADLSIPIAGPRNEGTLYVVATKAAGHWTFSTLELEVDGSGSRIPLLPPGSAP